MKYLYWKEKRKRILFSYFEKKKQILKSIFYNTQLPLKIRMRAFFFIKTFEKNSSITRFKQRCLLTNRGKSVFKKFGLSRLAFRRLALQGDLFGIKKSSW